MTVICKIELEMFIDEAKIKVRAGSGGHGVISFRHLKSKPKAGPDGGNGGCGGNIIIRVDRNLGSLIDYRYKHIYLAENGENGQGNNRNGSDGQNIILRVPPGTIARDEDGKILCDLTTDGEEFVLANGGQGGRGNASFVTSTRQAPHLAEKGEPGEEKLIFIELKILADVGLVGYPNVGKSTLIGKVSRARPKIADWPFTTKRPHLGVVRISEGESFVLADAPGLIKDAHLGVGLGHKFLRHLERAKILVQMIDLSSLEGRDPLKEYKEIKRELSLYKSGFQDKIRIVAGNKIDLSESKKNLKRVKDYFSRKGVPFYLISALTGEGVKDLVGHIYRELKIIKKSEKEIKPTKKGKIISFIPDEKEFIISKENGIFVVKGKDVERLVSMTDFENEEAVARLRKKLDKIGLEKELIKKGAKSGDNIKIGEIIFELVI